MSYNLNNAWSDLLFFANNSDFGDPLFYFFILLPLPVWWLLTKLFLLTVKDENHNGQLPVSREYIVHQSQLRAACMTALLAILTMCYLWSQGHYNSNPLTFSHLLGLVMCFILVGVSRYRGADLFGREKMTSILFQPLNKEEERTRRVGFLKKFRKERLWLLLPFLGFLMLLMLNLKKQNLVTIVLDNSASMENSNKNDIIPIEVGRKALYRTIKNLDGYTDLIIATFEESSDYIADATDLISKQSAQDLTGHVRFFDAVDKDNALSYVNTLNNVITPSSPLTETIWKSYLFSTENSTNKNYASQSLIMITDGGEAEIEDFTELFCDNSDFSTVFLHPENINMINLAEDYSKDFTIKMQDCGYNIQDGADLSSYNESLDTLMQDYKNNWSVIFWMLVFALVPSVLIFFVEPKKN